MFSNDGWLVLEIWGTQIDGFTSQGTGSASPRIAVAWAPNGGHECSDSASSPAPAPFPVHLQRLALQHRRAAFAGVSPIEMKDTPWVILIGEWGVGCELTIFQGAQQRVITKQRGQNKKTTECEAGEVGDVWDLEE